MRFRRTAVLCVFLSLLVGPALADEASRMVKAEEFFRLAKMDNLLKQSLEMATTQVQASITSRMASSNVTERENFAQFQEKLKVLITDGLSWDKLKPIYIKLYADSYTEQELDDIIAFYKSPSGQAMVNKTPELMQKSMGLIQQLMGGILPKIEKLAQEYATRK